MATNNEKINSKFRQLTDLLFCTDRKDLDLAEFGELLNNCDSNHINYFLSRFDKATSISWDDNPGYWLHRFCFILSSKNKKIKKHVCSQTENRFQYFIERASNVKDNLSVMQFVQICCARKHLGLPLEKEKKYLLGLSNLLVASRTIEVCQLFIPVIWRSKRHLIDNIVFRLPKLSHAVSLLEYLRKNGYYLDNKKIAKMAIDSCVRHEISPIKSSLFFNLLNNREVFLEFKNMYTEDLRSTLYKKIEKLGTTALTYNLVGLSILEMAIDIDPELSKPLTELYITHLYSRYVRHNRANVDRLVKLIKKIDTINPKIVLVCLTKLNKHKDIKKLIEVYPELKKLALFV